MLVYTVKEVAEILKLPEQTLLKYLRDGRLTGAKIGKHWRVTEEQLKQFLDDHTHAAE